MPRQSRISKPRSSETTEPRSHDSEFQITRVEAPRIAKHPKQTPEQIRRIEQKEIKDHAAELDEEIALIRTKYFAELEQFDDLKRIKDRLEMERELREGKPDVLLVLRHRMDADETEYQQVLPLQSEDPETFRELMKNIDRKGDLRIESEVTKIEISFGEKKCEAVFKPQDGEPLRYAGGELVGTVTGNHEPRGYLREWLAGFVAKAMEREYLVPPTVIREVDGRIGSVQQWVDGELAGEGENWIRKSNPDDIESLAALDYIIENRDRHKNNFLIDETGRVAAIDHGIVLSIDKGHSIRSYPLRANNEKEISPQLRSQLDMLANSGPRRQVLEKAFTFAFGMDGDAVFARFLERVKDLSNTGRFPVYFFSGMSDERHFLFDLNKAQNPTA